MLMATACLMNRLAGTNLPESDWSLTYNGLPLSIEEAKQLINSYQARMDLGIMSKPQLLAALDGITEEEARVRLREVLLDNAEFNQPQER